MLKYRNFICRCLSLVTIVLFLLAIISAIGSRGKPVTGIAAISAFVTLALAAGLSRRFKSLAFTIWIFAFTCCAFFYPEFLISWRGFQLKRIIVPLIQVIMFGMGMTLTFNDFARVIRMPKAVLLGVSLQFLIMPLMGFTFAKLFNLTPEIAVGLVLVGSCPGGTASNVIAYIANANVALSVTMTACSTILSPLITPLAMKILMGKIIPISFNVMMLSICKMIILPMIAGLLLNHYVHKCAKQLTKVLPIISMFAICVIIGITIALSRDKVVAVGMTLFLASICHNASGLLLGYSLARLFRMNERDSRTVAIEVGMQNGGMATGLAFNVLKNAAAAMPSAVFGPWSAVAGSCLASYWHTKKLGSLNESKENITVG